MVPQDQESEARNEEKANPSPRDSRDEGFGQCRAEIRYNMTHNDELVWAAGGCGAAAALSTPLPFAAIVTRCGRCEPLCCEPL